MSKHYHILRKINKAEGFFMCADPECMWTRKREFLIGKKFKCPLCGELYLATLDMLRRKFPHCNDCTNKKETETVLETIELNKIMKEEL
jgi:hypothetical protein